MTSKNDLTTAQMCLANPKWRLNNLYNIVDKQGIKTIFKLNWAQEELFASQWYCNLILKSRQLGISTYVCLLFLDRCLFNSNVSAGIIAHTLEDAQQMFRRVKFAYDSLPEEFKTLITADNDTSQMLKFSNGSSLRVGTSLRSSTFQYLHISEFGKICAKYPDKAREIITGALNTIASGQYVFIESTAEGREGYFYDMCKASQALKHADKGLTPLDFKFFFFPWWRHKEYVLNESVNIPNDLMEYFKGLYEANKINLTASQMAWYSKKYQTQQEDMKREYPSTPEESFLTSNEGLYYGKQIVKARSEKRIGRVPYDEALPVYVALDIGFNDSTAIWWYQVFGAEVRLIDYLEGSGEPLTYYIKVFKEKPYMVEKYFVPHDANSHEFSSGLTRTQVARNLGIEFTTVAKISVQEGIDSVRNLLNRCYFNEVTCEKGIRSLECYKKEWDDSHGCWRNNPRHDFASHGADAFRYLSLSLIKAVSKEDEEREYRKQRAAFFEPQHPLYGDSFPGVY